MVQRNRFSFRRQKPRTASNAPNLPAVPQAAEKKAPVVYGKPFILLEDANRNTFEYKNGAWIPHDMSMAECRVSCQVKELPQKVNMMTRYEVRAPLA